ncbi:winged helix-turn-helix transcriptional regulator [Bordetella genomosp. 9]|uniref:winged helix-turn-helix transcriptional regulator n=1 Tax=Bordetella genomosp. 9 TaxID=1416803 RepID=UPI0026D4B6B7
MTDPTVDHDPKVCEKVSGVLSRIADRWSMRVMGRLRGGPLRFSEIKRATDGISQRMLTLTLRNLERDGLLKRTVFPAVPPRVEYELTQLGASMMASIDPLGNWTISHLDAIEAARSDFDQRGNDEASPDSGPGTYVSRVHRIQ